MNRRLEGRVFAHAFGESCGFHFCAFCGLIIWRKLAFIYQFLETMIYLAQAGFLLRVFEGRFIFYLAQAGFRFPRVLTRCVPLIWRKLAIVFEVFMNVVIVASGRSIAVELSHLEKFWLGDYRSFSYFEK